MQRGMHVVTVAVIAVAAAVATVEAQDLNLAEGAYEAVWRGVASNARAGTRFDLGALNAGDARRDLIVSSPGKGEVYVLYGGRLRAGEINLSAEDVVIRSTVAGDLFGASTASGVLISSPTGQTRDLLVGAPNAFGGKGAVYLFRGGWAPTGVTRNLTTADAAAVIIGPAGSRLGSALATADFNNDGYREIIMGAPGAAANPGNVYIIYGGSSLNGASVDLGVTAPSITVTGAGIGAVLDASDVTGDGFTELIFGAPSIDTVYIIKGRTSGAFNGFYSFPGGADILLTGIRAGDFAGQAVATEDFNNDGVRDLFIGAPTADGPNNLRPDGGEVYLIYGASTLATQNLLSSDVTFYGAAAGFRLGESLTVGHLNRDSRNDLLMVAPGASGGAGEVQMYYGRARSSVGVLRSDGKRMVDFNVAGQYSRRIIGISASNPVSAAVAFEMTGEGARDVVVGVPTLDSNKGAAFVTLSPRLDLNRFTVNLSAGEGGSASGSVTVNNPSPIPTTWQVSSGASWVRLSPGSGSSSATGSSSFTITASAGGFTPGTYTTTVTVESTTEHIVLAREITVNFTVGESRFMTIESPGGGSTVSQPLTVQGWAIDTGIPTGTGVTSVDIQAVPNAGQAVFLGTTTYGGSRPSIGSSYGARFGNSGFTLTYNGTLPRGTYKIVAVARSSSGAADRWTKNAGIVTVTIPAAAGPPPVFGDFNKDGRPDLLWQHQTNGAIITWLMNGRVVTGGQAVGTVSDANWKVVGLADFNHDSMVDVLWQHQVNGNLVVWFMNGATQIGGGPVAGTVGDPTWKVTAVGDFNRDGNADLLWRHQGNGGLVVWFLNGLTVLGGQALNPASVSDLNWQVVAAGDFDVDGNIDLAWRHRLTGGLAMWFMNGTSIRDSAWLSPGGISDLDWRIVAASDLNNDGKPDLIWQHITGGFLAVWYMNGATMMLGEALSPGSLGDPSWRIVGSY